MIAHTGEGHGPNSPSGLAHGDQYWSLHPGGANFCVCRWQRPVHQGTGRLHNLPVPGDQGRRRGSFRRSVLKNVRLLMRLFIRSTNVVLGFAGMIRRARFSGLINLVRRLVPVVVCALGLGWHGDANASSISGAARSDASQLSQHCKCRRCRPATCCCGPAETAARASAPKPTTPGKLANRGPCLNSAPCGDSGLPVSPTFGPLFKVATHSMARCIRPVNREPLFPRSSRCNFPPRRAFRIDKPPEGLAGA